MIKASIGGSLARGGGLRLTSDKPRCLRIFLIISESSIKDIILIDPGHLEQTNGLTLCDPDRLEREWIELVGHVRAARSELVVLPEMPMYVAEENGLK